MSGWEITIVCLIAFIALSLFILCLFAVVALISIAKTSNVVREKVKAIDPLLHVINRIGRCVDDETEYLDRSQARFGYQKGNDWVSTLVDVAKWATIGGTIFSKFRKRS